MNKIRTGDLKLVQELNRSIILNVIREHGPISRSEIAKRYEISATTVASAIQELIKGGFVCEMGEGVSNGGRKPIMVKLASDRLYLIGVSISNSSIDIAQMDLEANISRKQTRPIQSLIGDELIAVILSEIEAFLLHCPSSEKCLGISITTPGLVDRDSGILYYNSKLRLEKINFKEIVESRFNIKTWVENDLNATVLAEKKFGPYGKIQNMIYVSISDGVGAGIFFHDILLRGASGGAGELGHIVVDRNGIRCECGSSGCLENYISWSAIYSRIIASTTRGRQTAIMELADHDISRVTPDIFRRAVEMDDPLALDLTDEISEFLGLGLVNLIHLFNPEILIIGGQIGSNNTRLIENVKKYVSVHALPILRDLKVCHSTLGENTNLLAAASIILEEVFHFSLAN
ncbi:ROK family transcriptional regulator [Paenibacillus sp. BR2-3]|uniref:ROK family transcriptional regulator n=1 Tax=Paenibacillus sp. BR2-3 TaxID=3048494 RepID=UPI003977B2B2